MQPPQLEQFEHRHEIRNDLVPRHRVGQHIRKQHRPFFQPRRQVEHALLDGEAVARDGTEHATRLFALRLPRQNTLQRAHQPIQRKPRQLDRLRRQRIFLRQLGKYLHRRLLKFLHASGALFIELVFLQPADERLFRRFLAVLRRFGRARQQRAGFDFQQRRGHGQKLAGRVHVQLVHAAHRGQILLGDFGNEYILDIHLRAGNQVQQQVERAFKLLEGDVIHPLTPKSRGSARAAAPARDRRPS